VIDSSPAPARSIITFPLPREPEIGVVPAISMVVPTRNESGNISELVRRLDQAMDGCPIEIIFVDDSSDDTPTVIDEIAARSAIPILLRHRLPEDRTGGLGGAVSLGISVARAPWVCVMDGDLQHPPELVADLFRQAITTESDVVIASRYCEQGDVGDFGQIRAKVSEGSTKLARLAFSKALDGVTDPMSGFFLIRRSAVDVTTLQPRGFKILLEILCRTPELRKSEVGFHFGERHAGESKATLQEGVRFGRQLLDLRFGPGWLSFVRFGLVGISGIFVNALALAFFTEWLGIFYMISAVAATQVSTLWNFALTETVVFDTPAGSAGRPRRAVLFFAMNNVALGLRGPMLYVLVSTLGLNYMIANIISLVSLMVLRYFTADRLIWGHTPPPAGPSLPSSDGTPPSFGGHPLASTERVR
jgi:dolichol-phosphate mannosyltransferase